MNKNKKPGRVVVDMDPARLKTLFYNRNNILPKKEKSSKILNNSSEDLQDPEDLQDQNGPGRSPAGPDGPESRDFQTLLDICTDKLYENYFKWRDQVSYKLRELSYNKSLRFKRCNITKIIYTCDSCGHKKKRNFTCEIRTCPECSKKNALKLYNRIKDYINNNNIANNSRGSVYRFRHVILTVPVDMLFNDTMKAYKRIEYIRQYFYKRFKKFGAVIGFEIGRKNLMVHWHLLVYSPWIDKKELNRVWNLGYTFIREVDKKNDFYNALYNVCLYVIGYKDKNQDLINPEIVLKIEQAIYRRRRVKTWGYFYQKKNAEKPAGKMRCKHCQGKMVVTEFEEWHGAIEDIIYFNLFCYNNKDPGG